ncbi:MAG: hypothetical protein Q4E50_03890 [Tissierellia bacterium]|nr:hypothetical protein [Tissierellia bacterium]
MKKYLQIIFVFIYVLLFFLIYQNFVEQDESNLHNLFGGIEKYERGSLVFNEEIDQEELKDIIKKSMEISNREDIAVQFLVQKRDENSEIKSLEYFVSANDSIIRSYLPKGTKVPEDFSNDDCYFTSRQTEDPRAIKIFSYFKDKDFTLYPMHMAEGRSDFIFDELDYYYTDRPDIYQKMSKEFKGYEFSYMDIGSFQFDKDSAIRGLFIYFSMVTLILCSLYILFKLSNKSKEIMVYKLQGYKTFSIIYDLFKSEIMINLLSLMFIPILGAFMIFKGYNHRLLEFLRYYYTYMGLIFLLFFICLSLGLFILKMQRISDLLKNKSFNQLLTTISFILAIVVSITILPKIEEPFKNLLSLIDSYSYYNLHSKKASGYKAMSLKLTKQRDFEYNPMAVDGEVDDPIYDKHIEIYNYLNQERKLYKFRQNFYSDEILREKRIGQDEIEKSYMGYEINEAYYQLCRFSNKEGDISKIDFKDDYLYIFMPRKLFNISSWKTRDFTHKNKVSAKIILYDKVDYTDLKLDYPINSIFDPIFVLEKDGNNITNDAIDSGLFIKNEDEVFVKEYLADKSVLDSLAFRDNNYLIKDIYPGLSKATLNSLIQIIPAVFILFMTMASMKHFYLLSNLKSWSVYKTLGYGKFSVVKTFIIELVAILSVASLYYIFLRNIFPKYSFLMLVSLLLVVIRLIVVNYDHLDIRQNLG